MSPSSSSLQVLRCRHSAAGALPQALCSAASDFPNAGAQPSASSPQLRSAKEPNVIVPRSGESIVFSSRDGRACDDCLEYRLGVTVRLWLWLCSWLQVWAAVRRAHPDAAAAKLAPGIPQFLRPLISRIATAGLHSQSHRSAGREVGSPVRGFGTARIFKAARSGCPRIMIAVLL